MTAEDAAPALVLLVDDAADNRAVYGELLRASGYRVAEAADGREAIARGRELAPDIVVMDLSLPLLDGWAAIRALKGDPRAASIPIVALSGHTRPEHARRAEEAGCDAFLRKPCPPALLLETLRELLARRDAPAGRPG